LFSLHLYLYRSPSLPFPSLQSSHLKGTWRSFNEIYKTDLDTYTNPVALSGIGYSVFEKEKTRIETENRKYYRSKKGVEQSIADIKSIFTWPL
jgi:hypothetical protein